MEIATINKRPAADCFTPELRAWLDELTEELYDLNSEIRCVSLTAESLSQGEHKTTFPEPEYELYRVLVNVSGRLAFICGELSF